MTGGTAVRRNGGPWLIVAALFLGSAKVSSAQETSLTIYSDGRVLVRRALAVALARGTSTVSVDLGVRNVDPGTFFSLDEGVLIRGARVVAATGRDGSLQRALGHDLDFVLTARDTTRIVRATLLSLDPPAVRLNGRVQYTFPGEPAFPDSLVQLTPRVELTVEAARAQPALRLGYMTEGLQWGASYAVVVPRMGAGRGSVTGTATISNPGRLLLRGAQLQLLAGDVRRVQVGRPQRMVRMRADMAGEEEAPIGPSEEAVGGTHVYSLLGAIDLTPGETRSVALFPRAEAQTEPEFILRRQGYGPTDRWPDALRDLHAEISYLVRRPTGTALGDTPLPAGVARVFAPDSAGRLQLLGEVAIGHTPAGRELHLTTGTAFDITAQRTQLTYEQRGRREIVASYRVQIQSARSEGVTVQVLDQFPGQWEIVSSTVPPERLSSSSVRFPVPVPAGGEAALEYRVRVRF